MPSNSGAGVRHAASCLGKKNSGHCMFTGVWIMGFETEQFIVQLQCNWCNWPVLFAGL